MIRYAITLEELHRRIDRLAPKWRAIARRKCDEFRKARRYHETAGTWSQIKQVYIDLQGGKCGYCERSFGWDEKSRIEHDVEHFRPKSSVRKWPPRGQSRSYPFETGPESSGGYYLLAYNCLNYLAACKKCNSPYKSAYFPIGGARRVTDSEDFGEIAAEQPLLLYPISDLDEDPEELITFLGMLPVPAAGRGHRQRRARVTIDFFDLDIREELLRDRAILIKAIYIAFEDRQHSDPLRRRAAEQTLCQIELPMLEHRNCARSFYRLCQSDAAAARQHFEAVIAYLDSLGS